MSDPDRRSSSHPSEPPLAFESRRSSRRGGPAPVTLIVSVLLLGVVGGGVFFLYRGGARGTNDAPQPVGAPLRDVRSPAPPQAQAVDPAAGLSIYKDDPGVAKAPAFVAPPEEPVTRAAPPAAVKAPPSAAANPDPEAPSVDKPVLDDSDAVALAEAQAAARLKAAKVKADKQGGAADRGSLQFPAARKAGSATDRETGAAALIQIGAFSSERLADKGWSAAAAVAPGAMAGKGKRVTPLTKDGLTLYRTAITGFASKAEAVAVCDQLKAANQSCFVR